MVLPASGVIYLSQVNAELGKAFNTFISLNQTDVRQLFQVPTGAIFMSSGRGKGVTAGAQDWGGGTTVAGQFTFNVPWYNSMYVQVRGAGGGGGASATANRTRGANGTAGGTSVFYSSTNIVGNGGGGGIGGGQGGGQAGANGTASGGSNNVTGGGSVGGVGASGTFGNGGNGGAGGFAEIAFARGGAGAPIPYGQITIVVGARGNNGAPNLSGVFDGTIGYVYVSWS